MEQIRNLFEIDAVGLVESVEFGTVDVEDSSHFATCVVEGYDNLTSGCRAACDVAGELVNVGNNLRLIGLPGGATHATSFPNARACHRALERTEDEHIVQYTVESSPPETKSLVEHGGHVGHVGDGVALCCYDCFNLWEECFVLLAFASSGYFKMFGHDYVRDLKGYLVIFRDFKGRYLHLVDGVVDNHCSLESFSKKVQK